MSVIARPIALMADISADGGERHYPGTLNSHAGERTEIARGTCLLLTTGRDQVVAAVELDDGSIEIWPAHQCKFVKSLKERMDDR